MAGPVPVRVHGEVKAGLLDLVSHAVEHGWSARRACHLLGLDHARYHHWVAAAARTGSTTCLRAGIRCTGC